MIYYLSGDVVLIDVLCVVDDERKRLDRDTESQIKMADKQKRIMIITSPEMSSSETFSVSKTMGEKIKSLFLQQNFYF